MILQILDILAPVIFLAAIGVAWGLSGAAFDGVMAQRLTLVIAGPCLVFVSLAGLQVGAEDLPRLVGASVALYALMGVLVAALLAVARLPSRVYLGPLVFGNTGNLGLPIALFAFGQTGLAVAIVVFAVSIVAMLSLGVWAASGKADPRDALGQPILYAGLLGGAWAWTGAPPLPSAVAASLELTGQMLIPIMLIALGVSICRLKVGDLPLPIALSVAKLAFSVVAALGAAELFGLDGEERAVLLLQAIAPVAVTSHMVAVRFRSDPDAVAAVVVVSTALSVATLPLALAILLP